MALDLVRDRPLLGIRACDYTQAEHDVQQMISAIVDVAHLLARQLASDGEMRAALVIATKGLRADALSESLAVDAITAAIGMGNHDEADRLTARFAVVMSEVVPDGIVIQPAVASGKYT
ncbi:hypothetical protein [Cellulomonas hominis]